MCIARTGAIRKAKYLSKRSFASFMTFRHFFLCLFFLKRFLRLWVAILLFFLFFPLGIVFNFLTPPAPPPMGGGREGVLNNYFKSFRYESTVACTAGSLSISFTFSNCCLAFFLSPLFIYAMPNNNCP